MSYPWDEPVIPRHMRQEYERRERELDEQPRCECGELLEGQYDDGEEHEECAACREGRLIDEAYRRAQEEARRDFLKRMQR